MASGTTRFATDAPAASIRSTGSASGWSRRRISGPASDALGAAAGSGSAAAIATGASGFAASPAVTSEDGGLEVLDELVEQLGAHVGHDPPAELRHLARDREVGVHLHLRARAIGVERGRDERRRVSLALRVASFGLQHRLVVRVVLLDEGRLSLVLRGDRARPSPSRCRGTRHLRSLAAVRPATRERCAPHR